MFGGDCRVDMYDDIRRQIPPHRLHSYVWRVRYQGAKQVSRKLSEVDVGC